MVVSDKNCACFEDYAAALKKLSFFRLHIRMSKQSSKNIKTKPEKKEKK